MSFKSTLERIFCKPILFLLFVNELPSWIRSSMKMFADDSKIWRRIKTQSDGNGLQEDLNRLVNWSQEWMLRFNPEKCKVMHIGHKETTRYFMTDESGTTELKTIQEEKDLGVYLRSDLKPSAQCIQSAAKARRIIGMIRRNFRKLNKRDFLLLYKAYIRPHLEYCVQAWSPHLVKDIEVLEKVQQTATKLVPELRKYDYQERLNRLNITTLQQRRIRGDLIEVFKIMTGKERIKREQFFQLATNDHGLRGNSMKITKERARLDIRKYSFSQRVVNDWNRLPQKVVDSTSINSFKNALDQHWKEMDNRSIDA